jgi:hypothetical protein
MGQKRNQKSKTKSQESDSCEIKSMFNEQKLKLAKMIEEFSNRMEKRLDRMIQKVDRIIGETDRKIVVQPPSSPTRAWAPLVTTTSTTSDSENETRGTMKKQVERLEVQRRKNNVILRKVPDSEYETNSATWNLVKNELAKYCPGNSGEVRRVHRLGYWQQGKNRAIVIELSNEKEKWRLLRYSMNFKEAGYVITDDLPPERRARKNELLRQRCEARRSGKRAKIKGDYLYVNNVLASGY